ncbi:hypothetical protein ONZ45_g16056 [Pleurotus djamor]|nr:hypothetical protein ONZ45_g16056 [Pleurotus djamor]
MHSFVALMVFIATTTLALPIKKEIRKDWRDMLIGGAGGTLSDGIAGKAGSAASGGFWAGVTRDLGSKVKVRIGGGLGGAFVDGTGVHVVSSGSGAVVATTGETLSDGDDGVLVVSGRGGGQGHGVSVVGGDTGAVVAIDGAEEVSQVA